MSALALFIATSTLLNIVMCSFETSSWHRLDCFVGGREIIKRFYRLNLRISGLNGWLWDSDKPTEECVFDSQVIHACISDYISSL